VFWDGRPGGDIRVLASIDDGGWRAFFPLTETLVVTPSRAVPNAGAAEPGAAADSGGR